MLIVHNTDIGHHADIESDYAYDAKPKSAGKLVEAQEEDPRRGLVVVAMKEDGLQCHRPIRVEDHGRQNSCSMLIGAGHLDRH
jgi:hypothetical protein